MQAANAPTRRVLVASIVTAVACGALAGEVRALAIFDFDDFPAAGVATADYGCDGKSFCTGDDTEDARSNAIASISTRVKGVEGSFSRPPGGFPDGVGIFPENGAPGDDSFLNPGNIEELGGDLNPYLGDFSRDLLFAGVSVRRARFDGVIGESEFAFLEIWSDPGGSGTLLGRDQESLTGFDPVLLSLQAPAGTRFRSIRFGLGLAGCASGCFDESIIESQGIADDIAVQPVPEPTAALLFATGAALAASAIRRRA